MDIEQLDEIEGATQVDLGPGTRKRRASDRVSTPDKKSPSL